MAGNNPTSTASPRLVVRLADGTQVVHTISAQQTTVGRDPSNDVCIPDHFVSKFHARILQVGDLFTLRDLGSANQTRVNGELVRRAVIRFGDRVQFAGIVCQFLGPASQEQEVRVGLRGRGVPRQPGARRSSSGETRPLSPRPPPPPPREGASAEEERAAASDRRSPERPRGGTSAHGRGSRATILIASVFVVLALAAAWVLRALPSPPSLEASGAARASESAEPNEAGDITGEGSDSRESERASSAGASARLEEARSALRALLEADPDNPLVRRRLDRVEAEIEQAIDRHLENAARAYEEAVAEWKRVLALAEPSDRRYREARARVEGAETDGSRGADAR